MHPGNRIRILEPLLRQETVARLLENWNHSRDSIFRPVFEDTPGSPVLFPAWTFPELLTLPEGKGGGFVLRNHPEAVCTVPIATPFELADADTPEMLEILKNLDKESEHDQSAF